MRRSRLFGALLTGAVVLTTQIFMPFAASAHPPKVRVKIVRPVNRKGLPVKGYKVIEEPYDPYFTCTNTPSPVAVDNNIQFCGSSADNVAACWESGEGTVLCLGDARKKVLYSFTLAGGEMHSVHHLKHPQPINVQLSDRSCYIRLGGAWDSLSRYPGWYGTYGCTRGAIYAKHGNGIQKHGRHWSVHVVRPPHGKLHRRSVRVAYFVGWAK